MEIKITSPYCDVPMVVKVSEYSLWQAICNDYHNGVSEAVVIDDDIYFYVEDGFLSTNPTDEEVIAAIGSI